MGIESSRNFHFADMFLRGLTTIGLFALSCSPVTLSPPSMPANNHLETQVLTTTSTLNASICRIYFSDDLSEENLVPLIEPETEPEIIEVPGVGTFIRTGLTMEGEASTYSRKGCLGCRDDRKMANEEDLDDNNLTLAALKEIPLNKYVLVENITDPDNVHRVVAKVTDRGGFRELGRIADLTLTTNHYIRGGWPLQVRLTVLEPIEPTHDNILASAA